MSVNSDINHRFNLVGMDTGDWFIGCTRCWFQFDIGLTRAVICPKCGGSLRIVDYVCVTRHS